MFTGIIHTMITIIDIKKKQNLYTHFFKMPDEFILGLTIGASISYNGCCLTVTSINENIVSCDLIEETLYLTNLASFKVGDTVNLERAAILNTEIGGHLMSGHIICTAKIFEVISSENSHKIWFKLSNKTLMKYILYKGYIGVDGISLTIGEVKKNIFCVHLIPETISCTTLGKKNFRDTVNIEIDSNTQAIVDTVERILEKKS